VFFEGGERQLIASNNDKWSFVTMSQAKNQATLDAVHKEIESTLQAAEQSLGRFLDDRDSGEDLQNCIDCLNQLRGIFVVVELKGATSLTEEAIQLATDVPVGATDAKNDLLSGLSDTVFTLKRYAEYLGSQKHDFPELLLSTINQMRLLRKEALVLESGFHTFDERKTIDLISAVSLDTFSPLSDFEHHAPRFRHVFQTGLVSILKNKSDDIGLKLIKRAAEGATRLSVGFGMAPFWALFHYCIDKLAENGAELIDVRKRLLMQVEKLFREMAKDGSAASDKDPDESLVREVAFLLAVVDSDGDLGKTLMSHIKCDVRYSEEERVREFNKFKGPGGQVIDSLSKALNEDILEVKEKLDLFERGSGVSDDEVESVAEVMTRLSSVLIILNLPRLSADCLEKAAIVRNWVGTSGEVAEEELLLVADAIIGVEAAIAKYKESGSDTDHVLVEKDPDNHFLKEARNMVVEESQGSLALAKRSISAYLDSGGDKLHLANVTQALDCTRGGLFLMGRERVSKIIASCEACIRSELIDAQSMPDEKLLETLADALSSIEYYLEAMGQSTSANEELLKLSEDSLKSIGYEVAA
jgi:hypothetical protein